MNRSLRIGNLWLVLSLVVTCVALCAGPAIAVNGNWNLDGNSVWGVATDPPWVGGIIADGSGFTADFSIIDITADRTVSLDTVRTISNLTFGDTATGTAAGWTLDNNGNAANILTLAGTPVITVNPLAAGKSVTISAVLAGAVGLSMEGGGILNLTAAETYSERTMVGGTTSGNTLNITSGGTVASGVAIRRIWIGSTGDASGSSTTGSNVLNISTPGNLGAPSFNVSGNGGRVIIGYASSSNQMNVSNGAYVAQTTGGGTNTWEIGVLAGADSNSMTITGSGSSIVFGSNQFLNVGAAGSGNSATVSAGGYFRQSRIGVGTNGGDNNYELITGAVSEVRGNAGSNSWIEVGITAGSTGNSLRVESGGTLNFGGTGTARRWGVGSVGTANNNYIQVTGATSRANLVHTGIPLAIGGTATGAGVMTDGGDGNHLDVYSGATLDMNNLDASNVNIPTGYTAVVLLGTNSAFNLGNGTGLSTAYVGATTNFATGVYLKNSDGRLNISSGKLIAGVLGSMVSGSGQVALNGPAIMSTNFASTISSLISGSGSLTKEGTGTLTLSNALNALGGDVLVDVGTLGIGTTTAGLSDLATVKVAASAWMDLNFAGNDTVSAVWLGGSNAGVGTFNAITQPGYFTGTGSLVVIPEPSTLVLLAAGLLGLFCYAWRRRRA